MRRMAKIVGRSDDMLIIRGVNVFPSQIEELVLKVAGLAPHYQLEVTRAGHLDSLAVHVECSAGAEHSADAFERLALVVTREVKAYVGVTVSVTVHPAGSIERSGGKAKRVIDKRR
jgi:phenylacetate-CoA ligase